MFEPECGVGCNAFQEMEKKVASLQAEIKTLKQSIEEFKDFLVCPGAYGYAIVKYRADWLDGLKEYDIDIKEN